MADSQTASQELSCPKPPLPGGGAEDVATQVTEPIERALANVARLEGTTSTSANSLSLVVAQVSIESRRWR